jgi:hypothetical protein
MFRGSALYQLKSDIDDTLPDITSFNPIGQLADPGAPIHRVVRPQPGPCEDLIHRNAWHRSASDSFLLRAR